MASNKQQANEITGKRKHQQWRGSVKRRNRHGGHLAAKAGGAKSEKISAVWQQRRWRIGIIVARACDVGLAAMAWHHQHENINVAPAANLARRWQALLAASISKHRGQTRTSSVNAPARMLLANGGMASRASGGGGAKAASAAAGGELAAEPAKVKRMAGTCVSSKNQTQHEIQRRKEMAKKRIRQ